MTDILTAETWMRRFLSRNECKTEHGAWIVFSDLFYEENEVDLSFHLRPRNWADSDVDQYRQDYSQMFTVPGVVQLGEAVFRTSAMPFPTLQDDPLDIPQYRDLDCSWPCPASRERAEQFADLATTALAADQSAARVVFDRLKLKKSTS